MMEKPSEVGACPLPSLVLDVVRSRLLGSLSRGTEPFLWHSYPEQLCSLTNFLKDEQTVYMGF